MSLTGGVDFTYLKWYFVLPNLLYLAAVPMILCYFFCRFCGTSFRWRYGIGYMILSAGLFILDAVFLFPGSVYLILEVLFLVGYGTIALRQSWREAGMAALLLRSVFGMTESILRWIDYQIIYPAIVRQDTFCYFQDTARELILVIMIVVIFSVISRRFSCRQTGVNRETFLLMAVPLFFIALVEQVLQDAFYGDSMIVDTVSGTVSPVIDVSCGEHLFLQVLAGACLLAVLVIYKRLVRMQLAEKKLLCLAGQAAEQKRYVEEAILRDRQTQAFRHDLNNHLIVLKELLQSGKTEEADGYLSQLAESAKALSSAVRTGNPAVDALLGSKCAVAKQRGIEVTCGLAIPKASKIQDIDWCILLSNAFDNAVFACEAVPPEKRYIRLSGKRKGNLYLLRMENSCDESLRTPPPEGTGLSNIRAVLEPLNGTVEKEISDGVYRLKLLFALPQQEKNCSHQ